MNLADPLHHSVQTPPQGFRKLGKTGLPGPSSREQMANINFPDSINTLSRCYLSPSRGQPRFGELAKRLPKLQAPLADALVADNHTAGGEDQLDVAQAEVEAVTKLDRVFDDVRREPEATVVAKLQ